MIKIFPVPVSMETVVDKTLTVNFVSLIGDIEPEIKSDFFEFLSVAEISEGNGIKIIFRQNENLEDEEYSLKISDEIIIEYGSVPGKVWALETLKQIFFQCKNTLPYLMINDKPQMKIRGFMLDCGRYFFPVDDVKLIIRRMAMHKLNLLHLHLTEDQGWRVQIDRYPLLTEKGSIRKKTNFGFKEHRGFYTKEDIREIVRYAHIFGIKVMPEFDIPGHSRAAIACYPNLTCFPRNLPVADHWGVKHDVLCVGKPSTYDFVKDVIDELCELFPDEYFHIGGDEVPKHRWKLCPHCQAKLKELNLKNEDELQCHFMNEMNKYCKEKGKQSFMWSWDLKSADMLNPDLGFTKCGNTDTGARPFIDTSTKAYYIDLPYGYVSLKDSADHKIFDGNALGVEATLWTEYVPDMKKADKMTYPRLFPLCETGWNGKCGFDYVKNNLGFYYSYLAVNGIDFTDIATANPSSLRGKIQVLLFERRQLAWEGLHNIFDDKRIEKRARKEKAK